MKATEFFKEGLLLVIKNYGGNTVDYAVTQYKDSYHLWHFNAEVQQWLRITYKNNLKSIFNVINKRVSDNPKIEE